jgi:hypothetical protein
MTHRGVYPVMTSDAVVWSAPVDVQLTDATERLAALFDTHHKRLYRLARRLSKNAEDARDLVQDTYLRAAQSIGSVPSGAAHEEAGCSRADQRLPRRMASHGGAPSLRSAARRRCRGSSLAGSGRELVARSTVWRALDTLTPRRRRSSSSTSSKAPPLATSPRCSACRRSQCDGTWRAGDGAGACGAQ